jgi:sporulation protein YlmC with PRC-barrel domain
MIVGEEPLYVADATLFRRHFRGTALAHVASKLPQRWNCDRRVVFSPHLFSMRREHMLMKSVATGLVGSALLATVAFAQSPAAPPEHSGTASATATTQSMQGDWRASKLAGLKVYNDANENIGSINDMLMDKSGNIKAVVIGVGGFLGMGEHLVAVPFDKIKFSNEPVTYTGAQSKPATPGTTTGSAATGKSTSSTSSKWYPDHAMFNVSKDDLKKLPEFTYSE